MIGDNKMFLGCFLVLFVVLCGGLTSNATYTCETNPYVNGCSVPTSMRNYRRTFISACNRHDICYACGSKNGISRRSCDVIFRNMIAKQCMFGRRKKVCKLLTFLSYTAVRFGGRRRYSRISPSWCSDRWASSCLHN